MRTHGREPTVRYLELVVKLLPTARRDWGRAMQGELATIVNPAERRRFALSCTRAALRQSLTTDAVWQPVIVTAAVVVVLGSEVVLAALIGQTVPLLLALALLAWLGRRPGLFGPVRPDRAARTVRGGGYAVMASYLGVLVVGYGASGLFRPEPKVPFFALLVTLYAGVCLAVTARNSRFLRDGLAAGAGAGFVAGLASFVVMPFERDGARLAAGLPWRGSWLVLVAFGAPAAAAFLTARRTKQSDQPVMAVVCAGASACLVIALLGLSAIALFPGRIPDIVGPVMSPGTSAAARQAANATEASDPYAGLLLFGGLLTTILWAMARPPRHALTRVALVALLGLPPVYLALSASHFEGAATIAVAATLVFLAAVVATVRLAFVETAADSGESALT